jgi:hypothetical protein
MRKFVFVRILVLGGAVSILGACGCAAPDRLAQANYDRIQQNASSHAEVVELIGEPDNKLGEMWLYERPDKHLTVMIDFDQNGKVERKQWIDGLGESWHDTKDTAGKENP